MNFQPERTQRVSPVFTSSLIAIAEQFMMFVLSPFSHVNGEKIDPLDGDFLPIPFMQMKQKWGLLSC